jgi:DNA replication and repair protein RecF
MYKFIELTQFRSYDKFSLELSDGVNIVVGPNGSGKTNLLESLHVLSVGVSFRASDQDLIKHDNDWFRIKAELLDGQSRIITCRSDDGRIEKQSEVDGQKKVRLMAKHRLPVVLFEPEHLRLLNGSPARRRSYMDELLIKTQPDYTWLRHQFERVLLQRNNILKRHLPWAVRDDQLFVWDIKFTEFAVQIQRRRQALVDRINQDISKVYNRISKRNHKLELIYNYGFNSLQDYQNSLLKELKENINRDSERGFTGSGPQRDDLLFIMDGKPAVSVASRGEVRSLLLALKIIELNIMSDEFGRFPLLLLDDVFSELDSNRRMALASIASGCQTLITTTEADVVYDQFKLNGKLIHL